MSVGRWSVVIPPPALTTVTFWLSASDWSDRAMVLVPVKLAGPTTVSDVAPGRTGTTSVDAPVAAIEASVGGPATRLSLPVSASVTAIGVGVVSVPVKLPVPLSARVLDADLPKTSAPLIVPPVSAALVAPWPR